MNVIVGLANPGEAVLEPHTSYGIRVPRNGSDVPGHSAQRKER